jgi:hypothetical protein
VAVKVVAYAWSTAEFIRVGGQIADRLRHGDAAAARHIPMLLNPFDRLLIRLAGGDSIAEKLLRVGFTAPAVIVGACAVQFLCGASRYAQLTCALGVTIALCSTFVLATAVLRRLVLGSQEWKTSDVQVPSAGWLSSWSAVREQGANSSVYFLVVVYLSVIGFAALYLGIAAVDPSSFAYGEGEASRITWVYFSFATLATVGYGDVAPLSDAAKVAVSCEIASGPLLLSWLLATFLSVDPGGGRRSLRLRVTPMMSTTRSARSRLAAARDQVDAVGPAGDDNPP